MWRKMMFVPSVLFAGAVVLGQVAHAAPSAASSGNGQAVASAVPEGRNCPQVIGVDFGDPNADPPFGSGNHNLVPNEVSWLRAPSAMIKIM